MVKFGLPVLTKGEKITCPFIGLAGYISGSGRYAYTTVPFPYDVRGSLAATASAVIRQNGKYTLGQANAPVNVSVNVITATNGILALELDTGSTMSGAENNSAAGIDLRNVTFTVV